MAFIDAQNLYHAAKKNFGYTHPNFNPLLIAQRVCQLHGLPISPEQLEVRLYTGIPTASDNPRWNAFWRAKLAMAVRQGVTSVKRTVRYREKRVQMPDGSVHSLRVGEEKAIDVRLALDLVRFAYEDRYDVAIIFSQDQDLAEATDEVKRIAAEKSRWIDLISVFPQGTKVPGLRGINRIDWFPISKAIYDECIDKRDYRKSVDPENEQLQSESGLG